MSNDADARRLALALPRTQERIAYGTPAFYVRTAMFARLHERPGILVCWRPSLEAKEELLAAEPGIFFTTDHYRGHPSVLVRLAQIDLEQLAEVLAEAWEARAPKRLKKDLGRS